MAKYRITDKDTNEVYDIEDVPGLKQGEGTYKITKQEKGKAITVDLQEEAAKQLRQTTTTKTERSRSTEELIEEAKKLLGKIEPDVTTTAPAAKPETETKQRTVKEFTDLISDTRILASQKPKQKFYNFRTIFDPKEEGNNR